MSGRKKKQLAHVRLYNWVLTTPAYRSLSAGARALLVELYAFYNGRNNGSIFLSVREAASRINVTKNTTPKLFRELEGRGFIRAGQRGAFTLKKRHATQWILTEFEYANQAATKDFMRWAAPEIQKPVPELATDRPNYCDRWRSKKSEITAAVSNSNTVATFPTRPRSQKLRHR